MGFLAALRFLTVFPVTKSKGEGLEQLGRSLAYFPLVGILLGAILAGLSYILQLILPVPVVSILLVAALVIMTGAHHIDGLIDTCDAMVTGKTREQRLAIMSDTRVGAFGITGACLILIAKYAAITQAAGFTALLIMPMLSRWALVGAILIFPSAKKTGMGFIIRNGARWGGFVAATLLSILLSVIFLGLLKGFVLMAGLFLLICCLGLLFTRLFGGLSGDNYGALIEIGEVLSLVLILILNSSSLAIPSSYIFKLPF